MPAKPRYLWLSVAALVTGPTADAAAPAAVPEQVQQCRAIADAAQRVARYDSLFGPPASRDMSGGPQVETSPTTMPAARTMIGGVHESTIRSVPLPRQRHAAEGDPRIRRMELRNGVIVISDAQSPAATHLKLTRQELAAFVLGTRPASAADPLTELNHVLDRSHLMPPGAVESVMKGMKAAGDFEQ